MVDLKIIKLKKIYDFYNYITNNNVCKTLDKFKHKLYYKNRFFNDNHSFFIQLKETFEKYTIQLVQNEPLYRARVINGKEDKCKFCTKEYFEEEFYGYNKKDSYVPPLSSKIKANRANAEGIPCLYTAKEEKTAIAEVRPFKGNEISVATIKIKKEKLYIYNLYLDLDMNEDELLKNPSDIWLSIAFAFSVPYEDTSTNDYLLTQCISEYIQLSGFDGIQYSSSLNDNGKNIALFNCNNVDDGGNYDICEPVNSHVCIVQNTDHQYGLYS